MGTIKVESLIDDAAFMLTDEGNTRWSKDALLGWFNQGQRALVSRRPDTLPVNAEFTCAAGVKQAIPDTGVRLMNVVRNIGGRGISKVEKQFLDYHVPDWYNADQSDRVQHFVFDERDPKTFYVYPPAEDELKLEIVYSKSPAAAAIADIASTNIEVDDVWANAILEYMLHRAWSKDAEDAGNLARSREHLQNFRIAIGEITEADAATSPGDS